MNPPNFEPTPETELLCADLPKDPNGRVLAHLLRRVDTSGQQSNHIIREQSVAAEERQRLMTKADFAAHEVKDDVVARKVDAIELKVGHFDRWRLVIKTKWKTAAAIAVPIAGLGVWALKLWLEHLVKR